MTVYVKRFYSFLKACFDANKNYPNYFSFFKNVKYFFKWWISLNKSHNSIVDKQPWICFESIDLIKKYLKSDMKIFEYGSGGSTLFFSSRCKEVISIEHQKEWFENVNKIIDENKIKNIKYYLIEPKEDSGFTKKTISNPNDYISDDFESNGKNYELYAKKIDEFPDEYFDLVLIDGRARPSCVLHSINKIKKGGMLVFDNFERDYYHESLNLLNPKEWNVKRIFGNVPYIKHFSMTLIATKN